MRRYLPAVLAAVLMGCATAPKPVGDDPYGFIEGLPAKGRIEGFKAGEVVPFDSTCADQNQMVRAAKISTYFETEATSLKTGNVVQPTAQFILVIAGVAVVGIAAGTAAGYGLLKAMERPAP